MGRETKNERCEATRTARGWFHAPCGKWFAQYVAPGRSSYLTHECCGITPETLRDLQRREWIALANKVREQSRRLEAGA